MKKLLVGLILVASSALSFGAQRVPYEKLSFPGGYISYNSPIKSKLGFKVSLPGCHLAGHTSPCSATNFAP